ncbi:hypothetical protein PPACK8108_LOCUS3985 [Phakopsora pachyrhizi]|uniref:Uncharacterized protein n=1 Tax=Phakopsora pachyrhizi TaxID=170000 RepID=A0AAV0AMA8_PHAPC|nr:hypothetical protein PPACK8108_LOCUS3985 [Phakopsora pachyrhizi]
MIEGRNIDKDIRNNQVGKSAGVAGWLKMPLFGYAIAKGTQTIEQGRQFRRVRTWSYMELRSLLGHLMTVEPGVFHPSKESTIAHYQS